MYFASKLAAAAVAAAWTPSRDYALENRMPLATALATAVATVAIADIVLCCNQQFFIVCIIILLGNFT